MACLLLTLKKVRAILSNKNQKIFTDNRRSRVVYLTLKLGFERRQQWFLLPSIFYLRWVSVYSHDNQTKREGGNAL